MGYGPWRNHMKRSKKHKLLRSARESHAAGGGSAAKAMGAEPRRASDELSLEDAQLTAEDSAEDELAAHGFKQQSPFQTGAAGSERSPKVKKRVRGSANEDRRLKYAARRMAQ